MTWSYTLGHIDGLWSYAYKCLGYCNKTLDIMPESSKKPEPKSVLSVQLYIICSWMHFVMSRWIPLRNIRQGICPSRLQAQELFDFCVSELTAIKR